MPARERRRIIGKTDTFLLRRAGRLVRHDVYPRGYVKAFIAAVKKYTDLQELDAAVLRAFIDRIEASHVDKKSRTREITIVYNFIGAFDFTRAIENARSTRKKSKERHSR